MPTTIKLKNSVTTTNAPSSLAQGEVAINVTDKKVWVGNAATTPVQLLGTGADGSFTNLAYTGTLTGGTGVVNLGSGQFYKDASGQVGVGVTPQTWSTGKAVEVGGNGCGVWGLASGTTYLTGGYYFNSTDKFGITGAYALYSQLVPADGSFRWASSTATGTAGNNATMSERMRIDSAGNVGIGTSSPAVKTEISGTAATSNLALRITNTATDGYSTLQMGGGGDGGIYRNGSAQSGYAGASSLNLITVGAHNIGFATGNTIRAIIPAAGGVQSVNCVSVGNATPAASGAGITFPATQSASSDANTLDDYEEGTWTPTITGGTTAGTTTYSVQQARYTKIGDTVQIFGYVAISSATGTGELRIGGLPFSTSSAVYSHLSAQTANLTLTANNYCSITETGLNTTHMILIQSPVGGGSAATVVPIANAAITVFFGGSYKV